MQKAQAEAAAQRDQRDYGFRQEQAGRQQANQDRSFGMQQQQFGLAQEQARRPNYQATKLPDGGLGSYDPRTGTMRPLMGAPAPKAPAPADLAKAAKGASDLRQEFQGTPLFKDTQIISSAYDKIANTSDTGPGDISLIFAYMKLMDPGSTVREGEFATAANAGSIPQSLLTTYNKARDGDKLAPELRAQFRREAKTLHDNQMSRYRQAAEQYRRLAPGVGASPDDVVLDYGYGAQPSQPGQPNRAAPKRDPYSYIK
ncbi:MAG TPA: hypothetical protein DCQ64_06240 [Candidatus Rokubacteria bacterium]|nr:hypothetical protein [Candidatus Rokubacteria bacterium]